VTFSSYRAVILLLILVPFAFIGGASALYVRGMNLNVSTGVGFAALFGVALMDGVLMVRAITTLRMQGATVDEAIVEGAESRLRPILMTALVAMFGLLPASLATGLGSDVQRPLATVIVWGLFSAMMLTLFILPVFYRLFVPPLPVAPAPEKEELAEFVQPLPDVSPAETVGIVEYVNAHAGDVDIFTIAHETQTEFAHVVARVKAAEMLGFVDTPKHHVVLTAKGRQFVHASPDERRALWREQLLHLGLFREIYDVMQKQPDHAVDRDFVVETMVIRMPYENYERVFNTIIRWARFGGLFAYDDQKQRLSLAESPKPGAV